MAGCAGPWELLQPLPSPPGETGPLRPPPRDSSTDPGDSEAQVRGNSVRSQELDSELQGPRGLGVWSRGSGILAEAAKGPVLSGGVSMRFRVQLARGTVDSRSAAEVEQRVPRCWVWGTEKSSEQDPEFRLQWPPLMWERYMQGGAGQDLACSWVWRRPGVWSL